MSYEIGLLPADLTSETVLIQLIQTETGKSKLFSEFDPYEVSTFIARGLSPTSTFSSGGELLWNPQWAEADRNALRTSGIKTLIFKPIDQGGYGYGPHGGRSQPFHFNDGGGLLQ